LMLENSEAEQSVWKMCDSCAPRVICSAHSSTVSTWSGLGLGLLPLLDRLHLVRVRVRVIRVIRIIRVRAGLRVGVGVGVRVRVRVGLRVGLRVGVGVGVRVRVRVRIRVGVRVGVKVGVGPHREVVMRGRAP
jgi:hypothetical protein